MSLDLQRDEDAALFVRVLALTECEAPTREGETRQHAIDSAAGKLIDRAKDSDAPAS